MCWIELKTSRFTSHPKLMTISLEYLHVRGYNLFGLYIRNSYRKQSPTLSPRWNANWAHPSHLLIIIMFIVPLRVTYLRQSIASIVVHVLVGCWVSSPSTPGLVEIRVSTERWPGHLRLPKKKKNLYLLSMIKNLSVVLFPHQML